MKVYIVCHEIGEYSDYRHSIVSAHSTEEKAQAAIDLKKAEELACMTKQWDKCSPPGPGNDGSPFWPRWTQVYHVYAGKDDNDIFVKNGDVVINSYTRPDGSSSRAIAAVRDTFYREQTLEKFVKNSEGHQGYYSIVEMEVD